MRVNNQLIRDMATALDKAVAMYYLLHSHAAGQSDLTEDQLANVVDGVCSEAQEILTRARAAGLDAGVATRPVYLPVLAVH